METKTVQEWFMSTGKVVLSFSDKERTAYIYKVNEFAFDVDCAGALLTLKSWQRITGRKP